MTGYCKISTNKKIAIKRKLDVLNFAAIKHPIAHIGKGDFMNIKGTNYLDAEDFNFDRFATGRYMTIFCFEILEHLQNPLFFLREIKRVMDVDCKLYLSTPHKPKFLWSEYHYNEISGTFMQKWLLDPLGLEIVRQRRLKMFMWADYLIGFRPLWRAIKTMRFLPLLKQVTNTTWIYEIRLKK